jgi:hypothetical protein
MKNKAAKDLTELLYTGNYRRCYKGYASTYAASEPSIRGDSTSTGRGPIEQTPTFKSLSRTLSVLPDCEKGYSTPEELSGRQRHCLHTGNWVHLQAGGQWNTLADGGTH